MNSNQNQKRKHFWTMQPCRPRRNINCEISQANCLFSATAYHQARYINCDQRSEAYRALSGTVVYHQQRGIAVHQQQSKLYAKALLGDAADEGSTSTAISKAKAYMEQLYITSVVYQPHSVEQKHVWRSCISPARYINRG